MFVGRLPRRTDMQDVHAFFSTVGAVRAIIPSRDTYLFIEYPSPEIAVAASKALNGQPFGGSRIVVQVRRKEEKEDRREGRRKKKRGGRFVLLLALGGRLLRPI